MVGGFAAGLGSVTKLPALAAIGTATSGDGATLQVIGSAGQGFAVNILYRSKTLARHNEGGEFSSVFQNGERSLEDRIDHWKATSWSGDTTHVVLKGECSLNSLRATVFVEVEYNVIDSHVVRKRIRFRQADMFMMFYQVSNRLEAVEPPSKFWSFDQLDCQGGPLREYFPAAGFRTTNNICVGLLTDAGYRNQWNRVVRRDGKPVKPAARKIPDVNLYSVARPEERSKQQFFVQQTFGEALEQVEGDLPLGHTAMQTSSWIKQGGATLEEKDGIATLSLRTSKDGLMIPISAKSGELHSVRLEYHSPLPIAAQIWDVDAQLRKLQNITLYDDVVPGSGSNWSEFRTTVFVPTLNGGGSALFLSLPQSEQAIEQEASTGITTIELRAVEVRREATRSEPYHRLEMDQQVEKTAFVFFDDTVPDTVQGYRMSSQIHLANGLGFEGGDTEKILYADLMMLCWNADTEDFRSILAPSIWYSAAGEMYLRDSFYALNGIHNRELNEAVFGLWAENQGTDGAINTLVEPNKANVERKSNDSTPLWLMWALLNRRRFNTKLPMEKVRRAAEYCLRTYDPGRDGICWAKFVLGQLDVIDYSKGTSIICENQGMLAVTLRVIKDLQIPEVSATISEEEIGMAENEYRSYYDPSLKFLVPARGIADAIGFAEIFPEYLSLWLFGRKLLTDEMVVNHLDRIPVLMPRTNSPYPETGGTVRPIFIGLTDGGKSWSYFTEKWHPMVSDAFAMQYAHHGMDGIYYNGGSWMRIEVCGYVTGMLHGWGKGRKAIANRLWAETHVSPDFPTSHEYLATDPAHPFFGYHRVFAWNSFVLQALEQAGLRSPAMDPDYWKK